jgi:cell wall-associated NlpC family hydrolase
MSFLRKTLFLTLIVGCMMNISCASHDQIRQNFSDQTKHISNALMPDETLNIFNADLVREDGKWILNGETTLEEARNRIIAYTNKLLGEKDYQNNFVLLPHENLGDKKHGIIKVSTANLREEPSHAAQLVDQVIIGQTVKLLKESQWWFLIQTQYGYIGWMTKQSIHRTDSKGLQQWSQAENIKIKSVFAFVYSEPDNNSVPVTDITMNGRLKLKENQGDWLKVSTPDGRDGYIEKNHIAGLKDSESTCTLRGKIITTAKTMTGIPYLWGGNSSVANDCSGFTQTVFRANGIELLRDARQQARQGIDIEFDSGFEKVLPGDLLFFGSEKNITHVGISMGGAKFIHQAGFVHQSSLDQNDEDYSESSRRRLKIIKRIITE